MSLKLVEGGYYLNRKGDEVGPMYRTSGLVNSWRARDRHKPSDDWNNYGQWSSAFQTDKDLVKESRSAFEVGATVEKFTGEARWNGVIVSCYLTTKGKTRYVVEVSPQGFQMIATPEQLRLTDVRT